MSLPRHPNFSDKVDVALMSINVEEERAKRDLASASKRLKELSDELGAISTGARDHGTTNAFRLAQVTVEVERALSTLAMVQLSRAALDAERTFMSDMATAALRAGPVASEEPVKKMRAAPKAPVFVIVEGDNQ